MLEESAAADADDTEKDNSTSSQRKEEVLNWNQRFVIPLLQRAYPKKERRKSLCQSIRNIEMTRKRLYDEIWEISVAGVAKKYNLPYAHLMKQIKEAGIPIPPSGYWTKLNFNKPVTKFELPEPADEMISIHRTVSVTRKKKNKEIYGNLYHKAEVETAVAECITNA